MNYNLKLRKIALSTLLLSAVASPVFADAGNGTPTDGSKSTETSVTVSAVKPVDSIFIAAAFPGLLDLVATYAPDTAQEWKDVLAKYEKITGLTAVVTNHPQVVHAIPLPDGDASSNPQAKTIVIGQAVAATPGVNPDHLIPAPIALERTENGKHKAVSAAIDVSERGTATIIEAAAPSVADIAFITAQTELSEAIESKDAAAIKQSLNELLKQYKILVSQLEGIEPTSKS
ncbi:hypothetical protein D3C73_629220 [compost metagenome]